MSQVQSLWQFYLAMSMLTVGMSFGTFIVLVATVGNWFVRKRARALATLMTCSSIGGITVPLLVWIIAAYGWREVLFSVGIGFWLVGFPAVFVMRTRPEDYGQLPDGVDPDAAGEGGRSRVTREPAFGVRAVLKTRFFWQFSVAASLSQLVSSTNLLYLPALNNFHVNLALAAAVISGVAIGDFIGRVSVGIVGDKYDNRLLIAASFGLQTIGVLALAATNASIGGYTITSAITLPIFAVGAGIGFGSSIPLRLAMLADYFGRRSFGSVVGVTSMVSAVFGAIGPIFAGVMFDLTDTYRPPFLIMAGLLIWAVPMTLTLEAPGRVAAKARLASRNRR
jgi:MFS family permease